jgi:putative flippase GtrA
MTDMNRSNIGVQFGWYLLVGGTCTVVDVGGFVLFTSLGLAVVFASPASFLCGTVVNYFLSYWLAFTRGKYSRREEIIRLFIVAGVGLLLNSLFVWIFIQFAVDAAVAKAMAIPPVLIWNFLARRALVFHQELPDTTYAISQKVVGIVQTNESTETDESAQSPK